MELSPTDILGPQGRIAARLNGYEERPQQLAMADAVASAIDQSHHLLVEAGTGVGKSFAYLVPAILAVAGESDDEDFGPPKRRIVISTHTISLQEQLIQKDLPFLNAVIPLEFSAVLVKGRSNYISLRRLANALKRSGSLFSKQEELDQLQDVRKWAHATTDGSLSDLDFRPLHQVWDEVQSDHGNCMGRRCPTYAKCFYYAARRRAQNAQLLIVNHALFFSDLALRRAGVSILPDYDAVIFDEAHTVEEVAADHLGVRISSGQVEYLLNRLFNDRAHRGLLVQQGWTDCQQQVVECHRRADEFFHQVIDRLPSARGETHRIAEPHLVGDTLGEGLRTLAGMIRHRAEEIGHDDEKQDFLSASDRAYALADELAVWLGQDVEDAVYWVETQRRRRLRVNLEAAPLELGPVLRESLFNEVPTVVMTSATLAVGSERPFQFFKQRIGLTQCETQQLGSPFNYREQAQIILPKGMPDPTRQSESFERRAGEVIRHFVEQTDGRAFVLFTSYSMLRNVERLLEPWLAERNLAVLSQASGLPRGQMIERFKANPRSVLFGTDSFWQGVDVPGDALQLVIIAKLPFSVPDHPLLDARLESIRNRGGNPFMEYQVPEAVIRLKQGFGRLIRSKEDTGRVVILDPRVTTKPYGRVFLQSLPECEVVRSEIPTGVTRGA